MKTRTEKMETPREFAEQYLESATNLPILDSISNLLVALQRAHKDLQAEFRKLIENKVVELKNKNKLDTLDGITLDPKTEEWIYIALHELTQTMFLAGDTLRILNTETVKINRKTIKYLKKAMGNPSLDREAIKKQIERLKGGEETQYHPIKEIVFSTTALSKPGPLMIVSGNEKLFYQSKYKKLSEMLNTPLKIKAGRPYKFFSKVLLIVIFKLLHEKADIPVEQAKYLTAEIINEYLRKQGHSDIATFKYKVVDNTLHN